MLETFEDRVSSLKDRETRLSQICKTSKGFRGNNLFLEGRLIQYCCSSVSCRSLSRENIQPYDSGLNVIFSEKTCVQNDAILPVNADNPSEPFAKLLK